MINNIKAQEKGEHPLALIMPIENRPEELVLSPPIGIYLDGSANHSSMRITASEFKTMIT